MEGFFGTCCEYFLSSLGVTAMLLFFVWVASDQGKGKPNRVFKLFKLSKKHVIGWTLYLCVALVVSGAMAYRDSGRIESEPEPTSSLAGCFFTIDPSRSEDLSDPAIRQLLASGEVTADAMSIDFVNETEVSLCYLGQTYNGHYTEDGSNVDIEIDAPVFPDGLSGSYGDLHGYLDSGVRMYTGLTWLHLDSNGFTYTLYAGPPAPLPGVSEAPK